VSPPLIWAGGLCGGAALVAMLGTPALYGVAGLTLLLIAVEFGRFLGRNFQ
jgi:hypothetical protein